MKVGLRIVGAGGAIAFGLFFYFTFGVPGYVEELGKEFVRDQVRDQTTKKIDDLTIGSKGGLLAQLAQEQFRRHQEEIEGVKTQLKNRVHERLA